MMSVSLRTIPCFSALSSSSLTSSSSSGCCSSNYRCRAAIVRITCCSRSVSVQEALPSQIKPPPPPSSTTDDEDKRLSTKATDWNSRSGIRVPRQRYISVSKSELLDAIIFSMFPSQEEARQFRSMTQCLDSILHAEHKTILEEMRADFDRTLSTKSKRVSLDDFRSLGKKAVANQEPGASMNDNLKTDSIGRGQEDETDTEVLMSSGLTQDLKLLLDFSLITAKRNPIRSSRVAIPGRFQRAFVKLLYNAEFEELSPRDLMLTSALNTDYLLKLPIYVDWRRASESSAIIFRRGYAAERQKGLLIAEKLDYLQSKLLQNFFFLIAKPLGRFGVWLNESLSGIDYSCHAHTIRPLQCFLSCGGCQKTKVLEESSHCTEGEVHQGTKK